MNRSHTDGVPAATDRVSAAAGVVDRQREVELLVAALRSGAHVVLEGPPGTGKSTLLRAVANSGGQPLKFVEGNAELTPARLTGHFDPAQVLSEGYVDAIFIDGPLVEALRTGALLYVEELNRVPEETLNLLLTVMSEGELHVPRLGRITAARDFRFVAAMNPYDAVGTARISSAIYDRTCRITMGYQSDVAETEIVRLRAPAVDSEWRARAVSLVRSSRDHRDIAIGSSVRGTIDFIRLTVSLADLRGVPVEDWTTGLDAATVALSGRVRLSEACPRTPEQVVRELYETAFGPDPDSRSDAAEGGPPGEA